ncbi:MAG: tripartite tricarboxylate transporter TctB family protein [Pseudolabrys sp.]|nr:tripartite tricarboxylate transporter TctB family protein [Pseudolabrys sp.]
MSSETEIIVEDPDAPSETSPPVANSRTVEAVVMLVLIGLALLLGWDNWRTGMSWESTGPQAGYFPFYLAVILGLSSVYGLVRLLMTHAHEAEVFVTRDQLRRVMQMFLPTLAFCFLMQWLGLYTASFLLIAGFMVLIGRIAWWKSLLTAFIFTALMFVTFEIAFDVLMPKGPVELMLGF